ncbi:H-NS histone family protein, partial [Paraburkholderia sp. SIMBA_049]
ERPQWLKQAISAGQSVEHFAVDGAAQSTPAAGRKVDWRQDPFAGSPLATGHPPYRDAR